MLNEPVLYQLMKNMDSKYSLVIIAAQRARAMVDKNPDLLIDNAINPVSVALKEIAEEKLHWEEK